MNEAPRRSPFAWVALGYEVVRGGLVELLAHKLRSMLTLTCRRDPTAKTAG